VVHWKTSKGAVKLPHAYCITLDETPDRTKRLTDHLDAMSVSFTLFDGINAEAHGLTTVNPYEVDGPGSGYIMPQKHTGLCLSHWLLWKELDRKEFKVEDSVSDCYASFRDKFLILEDDAEFAPDFRKTLSEINPPDDWDIILIGSCNCCNQPKKEVSPGLYKVHNPMCTHAYIVRHRALPMLINMHKKIWAPIDLALIFGAYEALNVYCVLPRIVSQHGQEICP
jgi:GR25 family glycosyltransferase involved in LPS biosynthesis